MVLYFLVMQFSLHLLADELETFKDEEEKPAVEGATPSSSVAVKIDSIKQRLIACAIGDKNHDGKVEPEELKERLAKLDKDQQKLVEDLYKAGGKGERRRLINVASLLTQLMDDDVMELIKVRDLPPSPDLLRLSPPSLTDE